MTRTTPGRSPGTAHGSGDAERAATSGQIIAEFRDALRELRCVGSQRLLRRGISMAHLHVMSMLERHGDLPMSGIADVLGVSVSNATGLIDRMEERGLVERVRVPGDRRVVLVRVTEAGRQAVSDVELLRDEVVGRVLARLDDDQLARVASTLADLRAAVAAVAVDEPDLFSHEHPSSRPVAPVTAGGRHPKPA